jgi:hypothetical protein
MSYTITTTAGATIATVADGTVNTNTTSLALIGKNYAGYGIFLNENYVKLLENFAYGTAPVGALRGQLWYDTGNTLLKVYDGSAWKPISSSAVSATDPITGVVGDLLWNTASSQLKVFNGSTWTTIGPAYTSTSGTSGVIVETVSDGVTSHVIAKFYISNVVIAILSRTSFTPTVGIAGFTTIRPGLNLVSSSTLPGSQFTGDVSNALTLQGVSANQFLRIDQNAGTAYQLTVGGGLIVGSDLAVTANSEVALTSTTSNKDLNFYVTKGTGGLTKAIGITGSTAAVTLASGLTVSGQVLPNANNTLEIGSNANRFANVWATTFRGTAITAQYADLAERFEADVPMVPGTVVELGGEKEVTSAVQELSEAVFGVISTLPGFLLNGSAGTDATHPAIAVNGRVPVRVIGQVRKGDRLVSAGNGLARAAARSELTAFNVLGRALEDKTSNGEGLVEAIVKLNS